MDLSELSISPPVLNAFAKCNSILEVRPYLKILQETHLLCTLFIVIKRGKGKKTLWAETKEIEREWDILVANSCLEWTLE